ncbi:MAG: hypothetical protein WAO55_14140 [Candidatus Manganitrophaceae bacterium]
MKMIFSTLSGSILSSRREKFLFLLLLFLFLRLFWAAPPVPAETSETEPALKKGAIITTDPVPNPPAPAALIRAIEERNAELDKKAAALAQKEERLRLLEKEIQALLKKSSALREALEKKETKRKEMEGEQFARLAKMYQAMPPEEAASRMERMEEPLALSLLAKMKEKSAAQILIGMPPAKAAKLTEKLANPPR